MAYMFQINGDGKWWHLSVVGRFIELFAYLERWKFGLLRNGQTWYVDWYHSLLFHVHSADMLWIYHYVLCCARQETKFTTEHIMQTWCVLLSRQPEREQNY